MKRNIIKFQIERKIVDLDLECVEVTTIEKSFDLDELSKANNLFNNKEYYNFQMVLKRYLLRFLNEEFSTCTIGIEHHEKTTYVDFFSTNYAYAIDGGDFVNSKSRGTQIRKAIDSIHTILNIKNHDSR